MSQILQALIFGYLVIGHPILGAWQVRRLRIAKIQRLRLYITTIFVSWVVTFSALLVLRQNGYSMARIGLTKLQFSLRTDYILIAIILVKVLAVIALLFALSYILKKAPHNTMDQIAHMNLKKHLFLLPHTSGERFTWFWVAVTAGICEEVIYRGFVRVFLLPYFQNVELDLFAVALIFGVAHLYQGVYGVVTTTILGVLFGALYLISGSLWLPILVHILVDVTWAFIRLEDVLSSLSRSKSEESLI